VLPPALAPGPDKDAHDAFAKRVHDRAAAQEQARLDRMKREGALKAAQAKYFASQVEAALAKGEEPPEPPPPEVPSTTNMDAWAPAGVPPPGMGTPAHLPFSPCRVALCRQYEDGAVVRELLLHATRADEFTGRPATVAMPPDADAREEAHPDVWSTRQLARQRDRLLGISNNAAPTPGSSPRGGKQQKKKKKKRKEKKRKRRADRPDRPERKPRAKKKKKQHKDHSKPRHLTAAQASRLAARMAARIGPAMVRAAALAQAAAARAIVAVRVTAARAEALRCATEARQAEADEIAAVDHKQWERRRAVARMRRSKRHRERLKAQADEEAAGEARVRAAREKIASMRDQQ